MATKQIQIGEKQYPIKYGWNALDTYCDLTKTTIGDIDMQVDKLAPRHVKALIWAGLKEGARIEKQKFELSLLDVGDLMDLDPDLITKVMELFSNDMAPESKNQKVPKQAGPKK